MNTHALYSDFDKETHKLNHSLGPTTSRHADTYHWEQLGLDLSKTLSQNMLINEIASHSTEKGPDSVEKVAVYLCYNWKSKTEFILVRSVLETTYSYYTPQYGRDDNYDTRTRGDYQFLAFSVEAFKQHKPELARCLENV
jgi:hypothetical protein